MMYVISYGMVLDLMLDSLQRRMAGSPVKGESYYDAEITAGRVGADQVTPKREF